jgi:hypothetical protein
VDHKQEIPTHIHADDGISGFLVPARIDDLQEGIEKGLGSLLKLIPSW